MSATTITADRAPMDALFDAGPVSLTSDDKRLYGWYAAGWIEAGDDVWRRVVVVPRQLTAADREAIADDQAHVRRDDR